MPGARASRQAVVRRPRCASGAPGGPLSPTPFRIHFFPECERFARALGRAARTPAARLALHRFPDGESLVRVRGPAGPHAVLVRSLFDPNAKLLELLLAADALRRAGARTLTLVAPYLPYMRQDRVFSPGEPVSQRVVGALLGDAFEQVLTLEAHLHRVARLSDVVPGRARSLSAAPALAAWARRGGTCLLVGPDEESEPWVRAIATRLGALWTVGSKRRASDRSVRIAFPRLPAARRAVLVDDIASSGATLAAAARALRRRGVARVEAAVVHAIFEKGALTRVRAAGVARVVSCDTVPHATNAVATAPIFAQALR